MSGTSSSLLRRLIKIARACTVCEHPQLDEINTSLALRSPHRFIAEQFSTDTIKLSPAGVQRHAVNHLGNQAVRTLVVKGHAEDLLEAGLVRDQSVVLQLMAQTLAVCQDVMQTALDNDKPDMVLKAAREVQGSLSLIHKFTAKVEGPQGDPQAEEDLKALSIALVRILPNHREAAKDLVRELEMADKLAMANTIKNRVLRTVEGEVA